MWRSTFVCLSFAASYAFSSCVVTTDIPSSKCTAIHPIPRGELCHARGTAPGPSHAPGAGPYAELTSLFVNNLEECTSLCLRHREKVPRDLPFTRDDVCQSVGFNETSKLCTPSGLRLNDPNPKRSRRFKHDQSSDSIFWNTKCFRCPSGCPARSVSFEAIDSGNETGNLIDNGSFEASDDVKTSGPWRFRLNTARRIVQGSNSSKALFVDNGFVSQAYQVCPDQLYLVTFDYKITQPGEYFYTDFPTSTYPPSLKRGPFKADDPNLGRWIHVETCQASRFDYTVPLPLHGNGGFFLDNVGIYPIATPLPTRPETELIKNGDFETGDLQHWVYTPPSQPHRFHAPTVVTHAQDNRSPFHSLAANFQKSTTDYVYNASIISQHIATGTGKRYVASADYYTECITDIFVHLNVDGLGSEHIWMLPVEPKEKMRFERVFMAERDGHSFGIATNGDRQCGIYFDNFSVMEIA